MNIIKKIFDNSIDEDVHRAFVKFGKGSYENKYLLEGKKQKDKWTIKASSEYVNFIVEKCLKNANGKIQFTGAIISTQKIDLDFVENIKQFMGVKQYLVNTEVDSGKILDLMEKNPKVFFALSFKTPTSELKTKAKTPKSSKPSASGEKEAKADFCTLKTTDKEIIDDLFFENPNFRLIKVKHSFKIDQIIIPKGFTNPEEIREKAIRIGVITREVNVDGKDAKKIAKFEA